MNFGCDLHFDTCLKYHTKDVYSTTGIYSCTLRVAIEISTKTRIKRPISQLGSGEGIFYYQEIGKGFPKSAVLPRGIP